MLYGILILLFIVLFHAWLYAWYFPRHCLSGRRVTLAEHYRAFYIFLLEKWKHKRSK